MTSDILDAAADRIREIAAPIRDKWRVERPSWRWTDSPLKYVDWAMEETIAKSANLCRLLHPHTGSQVVELGPGACYLAYMLRRYGCTVMGYDLPDRPLYRDTAEALGVEVEDWTITPDCFPRPYADLIVATQISWLDNWTVAQGQHLISELLTGLSEYGRIVLFPNPKAFKTTDALYVWQDFRPVTVQMDHLGRGFIFTR